MACIAGHGRLVDVGPWVVMAAELGGKVGWKMDKKKDIYVMEEERQINELGLFRTGPPTLRAIGQPAPVRSMASL